MTVTVIDNQNPIIACPSNITQNTGTGLCNAVVSIPTPATMDNCGIASLTNSVTGTNNASGTYGVGTTQITGTVTDIHGNTATCKMTVTIVDNQNPSILCPSNRTVNTDQGLCSATNVSLGTPTTADNCGVATVTNNAPAVYPKGNTTVIWVVTDIHGNTMSCGQTVTVIDNQPPSITCPPNKTVTTTAGTCTASNVSLGTPVIVDNCPGAVASNNGPSVYPLGLTTVIWTVTDLAGLTATCIQTVTVTDNQPPTISCPQNLTVNTTPGLCYATGVVLGNPVATDLCGGIVSVTNNAPSTYPIGITNVIWVATDAAGNTASCQQRVTVIDNQPPLISCPANVTTVPNTGLCTAIVNNINPVYSDNCPNPVLTYTKSGASTGSGTGNVSGHTFNIGVTTVTYTVTDANGLTASCAFTVTVNSPNLAPVAVVDYSTTSSGTPVIIPILNNDTDPDSPLNLTSLGITVLPLHGTLTVQPNGSVIYTPSISYTGSDSFIYVICDDGSDCSVLCDTAIVKITVQPRNIDVILNAYCENNIAKLNYQVIATNFTPTTGVTIRWVDLNGVEKQLLLNQSLSGTLNWPGMVLDGLGNPIDWPGWIYSGGSWAMGEDGFATVRPNVQVEFTLSAMETSIVTYPIGNLICNPNPPNPPTPTVIKPKPASIK